MAISAAPPLIKFILGPVVQKLESLLHGTIHGYKMNHNGKPCKTWHEMEDMYNQCFKDGFNTIIDIDGSAWDSTQHYDMKYLTHKIYKYLCQHNKIHHIDPELFKTVALQRKRKLVAKCYIDGKTHIIFSALIDGTTFSGAIMDEGVYQRGVQAAQKAGIDYRDPTQVDNLLGAHRTFDTRLAQRNEALQRFKPQPLNEGGFAKVPSVDRNELQKIYRGQDTDKLDFSNDRMKLTPDYRGVAFSSDLEMAKPYGKNIVERYIPKNRVLKAKDIPAKDLEKLRNDWKRMSGVDDNNPFSGNDNDLFQQEYEINKILKIAQDQGKDAVDVADIYPFVAPEAEIRVINPGALQDLSKPTKNKLGLTKLNEGGFVRVPGKSDPLEALKQEATGNKGVHQTQNTPIPENQANLSSVNGKPSVSTKQAGKATELPTQQTTTPLPESGQQNV